MLMYSNESGDKQHTANKASLFCLECGYEGEPEDMLEVQNGCVRILVCPDCGGIVDQRPYRHPMAPAEAD